MLNIVRNIVGSSPILRKAAPLLHNPLSTMETPGGDRLIWIDCEMTGLNLAKDEIMEIAVIVTDGHLNEVARSEDIIIKTDKALLDSMDEWCTQHHGKSGLTRACLESNICMAEAEKQVLEMLEKNTSKGVCPLAGNSVGQDRKFLEKCMPTLASHLHYRTVDVSTIKELGKRWNPEMMKKTPLKRGKHRALDDIEDSIAELKYYREHFFKV